MIESFWQIVWRKFKTHRAALVSLFVVTLFMVIALLAPVFQWLSGVNPETQNALARYLPVWSHSEISSDQRETLIEEFQKSDPAAFQKISYALIEQNLVSGKEEDALYTLATSDLDQRKKIFKDLNSEDKKSATQLFSQFASFHVLGTDELGRDVLMRLIFGAQVSLGVGILVALASSLIGLLFGAIAGYYGGALDIVLMRFTDALLSLPLMPVLIVVAAINTEKIPFLGLISTPQTESIFKLVFILVLFSWMQVALLVRAEVLTLREREFILASKSMGASTPFIILRHLVPNVIAPLLVSVTLGIGESIQFEAALSFLGLGVQQPIPSWGNMLFNALDLLSEAPIQAVLPGVLILLMTICFNYMGDGLQDAVNPKSLSR